MSIPKLHDYPLTEILTAEQSNVVQWPLEKNRAALLIHDMQNYFIDYYEADTPLIQNLLHNIETIKNCCRRHDVPIIYTAQPPDQRPEDRALLTDFWGDGLRSDGRGTDVVSAIAPGEGDTVLTKWRYSAFQRTALHQLLHEDKRDQLIIVGVYAHIGVLATALESFMTDIQAFVVADAVADFDEQSHLSALNYIAKRCGRVCTAESLLNELELRAMPTGEWKLVEDVTAILNQQEPIGLDDDLFDWGLDSIRLMTLLERWQEQGIMLTFQDIAHCNTLRMIREVAMDQAREVERAE